MRLVGIAGRAGAGKSMVAERMQQWGDDYVPVSFATPLKQMATRFLMDNYGYTEREVLFFMKNKTLKLPELGVTMRHFLQTLGTDWGRDLINPFIWVNLGADCISELLDFSPVVVDDLRFETEAAVIRGFGGLVIHLVRPGGGFDDHASEVGIKPRAGDVLLLNNGSELALMAAVAQAIERFYSGTDRLLELCHTPCWSYEA